MQTDSFSIELSIFANNSAKEPQTKISIMQFWIGSPAETVQAFRVKNRQLIALSADITYKSIDCYLRSPE